MRTCSQKYPQSDPAGPAPASSSPPAAIQESVRVRVRERKGEKRRDSETDRHNGGEQASRENSVFKPRWSRVASHSAQAAACMVAGKAAPFAAAASVCKSRYLSNKQQSRAHREDSNKMEETRHRDSTNKQTKRQKKKQRITLLCVCLLLPFSAFSAYPSVRSADTSRYASYSTWTPVSDQILK